MIIDRQCKQCGRSFKGGPRAWYCPDCRETRRKEAAGRYRKNGPGRALGSTDKCKICGKDYVVNGSRQKYCPDCSDEAVRRVDRRQGLDYYHSQKADINPKRNEHRKQKWQAEKQKKICPVCGGEFIPRYGSIVCSEKCRGVYRKRYMAEYDRARRGRVKTAWGMEEDETLIKYYPSEGAKVSERLPNRSKMACRSRAQKLGVHYGR